MSTSNKTRFYTLVFAAVSILAVSITALPQSGGPYVIQQSVIAGGGAGASGGPYSLCGTAGQSVAGQTATNSLTSDHAGFWNAAPLSPTAALVSVSGKVSTPDGRGLRNAIVVIIDSHGTKRTVTTSSFGFYVFYDVAVGETYVIRVSSKRYRFAPMTLPVADTLTGVDFVGSE